MSAKKKESTREHTRSVVQGAAKHSVRMARHLLHRTRILTRPARQAMIPPPELPATVQPVSSALAAAPDVAEIARQREAEWAQRLADAEERARRAEQAATWLRARLRTANSRNRAHTPRIDPAALTADLVQSIERLRSPQPGAIRRVVEHTLGAHGLPVQRSAAARTDDGTLPWSRLEREALARAVLARSPEVADPAYVNRVLTLVAQHDRLTLADLMRVAGLESAMARRRLRLAVDALVALGPLALRDTAYVLNTAWSAASVTGNTIVPRPAGRAPNKKHAKQRRLRE